MNYGYVISKSETDFIVNVEPTQKGSGYNVVPKEVDPYNKYDIADVQAYVLANPSMLISGYTEPVLTDEQQREVMYKTLRYRLVGDTPTGALDYSRPFYETLTVDEMSERFIKYLGDNDEIANASLAGKVEAKNYIRSLF